MQINITARHLDVDDKLKAHANERLMRLSRYSHKIEEARVVFSLEKFTYISEIILTGKHLRMSATGEEESLRASFDECLVNIEKQLEKFRSKAKGHKVKKMFEGVYNKFSSIKKKEKQQRPQIIKTELISAKPMSVEEASLELEVFKKDFIAFRNSQTEDINVIYRRKDGNYGLIES